LTETTAPTTVHTSWCDPAECSPTQHWSAAWILPGHDLTGMHPRVAIHVTQHRSGQHPIDKGGPPYIDMTVHTPPADETDTEDPDYTIVLTPERALALGDLLTTAAQAAMRHRIS
jgi:hypothetical protein